MFAEEVVAAVSLAKLSASVVLLTSLETLCSSGGKKGGIGGGRGGSGGSTPNM